MSSASREEFSIVLDGPLFGFYLRYGLVQRPIRLVHRRIALFLVVAWLPLFILTLATGSAFYTVKVPFLQDFDAQIRLLFSVPLLLWAESIVHYRICGTVQQFFDRGLVIDEDRQKLDTLIVANSHLAKSNAIEILLLLVAIAAGNWLWREQVALHVDTWYADFRQETMQYTMAGCWYAFVALPIARFLMLRWYFRILLWYYFLYRVSRLDLQIDPLHPDRAGGLGFLGNAVYAFAPIMIAQSSLLAGIIANLILHEGAELSSFKVEIAAIVGLLTLLILFPLFFFFFPMAQSKRSWRNRMGVFAMDYTRNFRQKWLHSSESSSESSLGSSDIQSLADLSGCFAVVRKMRLLPFGKDHVIHLAILIAVPIAPLILTMIPIDEIVSRIIQMLL